MFRALLFVAVCSTAACGRPPTRALAPSSASSAALSFGPTPLPAPLPARVERTADMGDHAALPLRSQHLAVEVDGPFATVVDERWYDNRSGVVLEGLLGFDLDPSARVSGFSYWNGEARIVGEVLPTEIAEEIYDRTMSRGRDPGLLEQVAPGRYSLRVAPIAPSEAKRVQITHERWLDHRAGELTLRTPLAAPDATITVELDEPRTVTDLSSPTHALAVERRGSGALHVTATPIGDPSELTLRWHVPASSAQMHAFVHRVSSTDGYVVLSITPGARDARRRIAKDVTLVLDESASMNGEALAHAKRATAAIVRGLPPGDRVNVIRFSEQAQGLFGAPRPADAATIKRAITFIEHAGDGGGTEIAAALALAVERQHKDARPKTILLLTDGKSNREPALAVMAPGKHDLRLFTLGIGDDVDANLLTRLATQARGRYSAVADVRDIERTVAAVRDRIDAPALVDLAIDASHTSLTRLLPEQLPDLSFGDELLVVARLEGPATGDVVLHGTTRAGPIELRASLDTPRESAHPWAAAMWARARIDDLLVRIDLDGIHRDEQIEEVTRLGVANDLVTPYTAFLAIPESELTSATRGLRDVGRRSETSPRELSGLDDGLHSRDFTDIVEGEVSRRESAGLPLYSRAEPDPTHAPAGCAHCRLGDTSSPASLAWPWALLLLRRRRSSPPMAGGSSPVHATHGLRRGCRLSYTRARR